MVNKKRCKECQHCQQAKIVKHTKIKVYAFDLNSSRFQTVHVDIASSLPPVKNPTDSYFSP